MNTTQHDNSLAVIRSKILEIESKMNELTTEKRKVELNLMKIKNTVRQSRCLPAEQYKACCNGQEKAVAKIVWLESELKRLKLELKACNIQESEEYNARRHILNAAESPQPTNTQAEALPLLMQAIRDLERKYRGFSADPTRVSSMRTSAALFANELNELIREARKAGKDREATP
jgi:hypothetical protein